MCVAGHRKDDEIDRDASDSDSDDDDDNLFRSRNSDSGSESDAGSSVEMPSKMASIGFRDVDGNDDNRGRDADSDGDSDEPPEIPGSPMATQVTRAPSNQPASSGFGRTDRLGGMDVSGGDSSRLRIEDAAKSNGGANVLRVHRSSDSDSSSCGDEDDEYVVKDAEQPRSTEFHASSSSESDDGSDDNSDDSGNNDLYAKRRLGSRSSQQVPMSNSSRPKTAAKDLECYRDVIPDEFFQQIGDTADDSNERLPKKEKEKKSSRQHTKAASSSGGSSFNGGSQDAMSAVSTPPVAETSRSKYAIPVPQEVENLFQVRQTGISSNM